MNSKIIPSQADVDHLKQIRKNIIDFMRNAADRYISSYAEGRLLDIAPQDHSKAELFFSETLTIQTLDIDPPSGCTYITDICKNNETLIPTAYFDYVVCTEVLEHTLNPFAAVQEIWRILKTDGKLFLSVPFNFRIHGPLPDCWRFTEHGLKAILKSFSILELNSLETKNRPLMPIHYTVVAKKKGISS